VRIGGVDAVHVGPNDKLVGVDHVRNQRAGKVRTVPAERRDTAIASRTDESGYHGNEAVIEERKKNLTSATARFVNLRASIAERVASQNKFRGADGNGGHARLLKSRSKEAGAESLAVRCETILQRGATSGARLRFRRRIVQQVLAEELKCARNAIVLLRFQTEIAKHFHVELKNALGVAPGIGSASGFKRARDPQQTIGNPLHRRNNNDDVRARSRFADDSGSMEHALCAEKRAPAKLKRANRKFRFLGTFCERGSKRSSIASFYW
jgi:hypothetical protein